MKCCDYTERIFLLSQNEAVHTSLETLPDLGGWWYNR